MDSLVLTSLARTKATKLLYYYFKVSVYESAAKMLGQNHAAALMYPASSLRSWLGALRDKNVLKDVPISFAKANDRFGTMLVSELTEFRPPLRVIVVVILLPSQAEKRLIFVRPSLHCAFAEWIDIAAEHLAALSIKQRIAVRVVIPVPK